MCSVTIRYGYEFRFFFTQLEKSKQPIKMSLLRILFCHKATAKPTEELTKYGRTSATSDENFICIGKTKKKKTTTTTTRCNFYMAQNAIFGIYLCGISFWNKLSFHYLIWFILPSFPRIHGTCTIFVFIFSDAHRLFGGNTFHSVYIEYIYTIRSLVLAWLVFLFARIAIVEVTIFPGFYLICRR